MKRPTTKRAKHFLSVWIVLTLCAAFLTTTALATGTDPITVVNNLSDFIFPLSRPSALLSLAGASSRSVCRSRAMTPARDPRASCACSAAW